MRSHGIRVGKTDIAHWMLCLDDSSTVVHLAYISADRDIPALLPLNLLSDEER